MITSEQTKHLDKLFGKDGFGDIPTAVKTDEDLIALAKTLNNFEISAMEESNINMEVRKISPNDHLNCVIVTVGFSEKDEKGVYLSGTVEIKLDGQDFSVKQIKKLSIDRARKLLRRVADHGL